MAGNESSKGRDSLRRLTWSNPVGESRSWLLLIPQSFLFFLMKVRFSALLLFGSTVWADG